jgi:alpha-mannosidase
MVSSVKRADRGDEIVVRLWESAGAHRSASLSVGAGCGLQPIASATRTDALERDLVPLPASGGKVALSLRPFELVTLKLQGPSPQPSRRSSETESPSTSTNEE